MQETVAQIVRASAGLLAGVDGGRLALQLVAIGLAGSFGGLVYGIVSLFESGKVKSSEVLSWQAAKGAPLGWYLIGQQAIGIGGAFAAVLAVLTAAHVAQSSSADDFSVSPIYWIALCVVGGFVGNRLLAVVGADLVKRATNEAKHAVNVANDATREVAETAKQSEMIFEVLIARDADRSMVRSLAEAAAIPSGLRLLAEQHVKKLSPYVKDFPTMRVLNIVLANLKFDLGQKQDAIDQLRAFLAARRSASKAENDDDAAAHFNLACFFVSLAKDENTAENMKEALSQLSRCFNVARGLGNEILRLELAQAKEDPDLALLRETQEWKDLLAAFEQQLIRA